MARGPTRTTGASSLAHSSTTRAAIVHAPARGNANHATSSRTSIDGSTSVRRRLSRIFQREMAPSGFVNRPALTVGHPVGQPAQDLPVAAHPAVTPPAVRAEV